MQDALRCKLTKLHLLEGTFSTTNLKKILIVDLDETNVPLGAKTPMKRSPGKDPEPVSTEKHPPSVNLVVGICEDGVFCSMAHFVPTVHIPCSKLLLKDTREAWNEHFGNEYYWRTDVSLKKFLKKRRAGRRMTKKSLMQR